MACPLISNCILRDDSAQKAAQKIGSGYYAFFVPPDQDQIIVDDIIFRMLRLHPHAADHAAQRCAHIRYDDRAMPVDFRVKRWLALKDALRGKLVCIQHK